MKNKVLTNERYIISLFVCLFFFSFFLLIKPALNNLDKLDDVVTELILRKENKV